MYTLSGWYVLELVYRAKLTHAKNQWDYFKEPMKYTEHDCVPQKFEYIIIFIHTLKYENY